MNNHNQVLGLTQQYEDVLYRLSTNPDRGTHRGTGYCTPNRDAPHYRSITELRAMRDDRTVSLNFSSVHGSDNDHIEYRTWDATLDPAVIQAQVVASLAITEAAFRDVAAGHEHGPAERKGTHRSHNRETFGAARHLTGEDWRNDTATFPEFVDHVAPGDTQKEILTTLFAATKWQRDD